MASLEIVALDTVTPQLRAPAVGDTYSIPRNMISVNDSGYFSSNTGFGLSFNTGGGFVDLNCNGGTRFRTFGTAGACVDRRLSMAVGANGTEDCGFERIAAKVIKITDGGALGSSGSGVIQLPTFTVATLPTAASAGAGARSTVSDGSVVAAGNFGAIVAGAGANMVPVYSDATNWRIG